MQIIGEDDLTQIDKIYMEFGRQFEQNFLSQDFDRDRTGVILASGIGGIETISNCENVLNEKGPSRVSPYFIPS